MVSNFFMIGLLGVSCCLVDYLVVVLVLDYLREILLSMGILGGLEGLQIILYGKGGYAIPKG